MKSLHLYIALIFASVLAFQAASLKLSTSQESLALTHPVHTPNFKQLLREAHLHSADSKTVANVLKYYIDGTAYFNYIQKLFCAEGGEFLALERFYEIAQDQGVHKIDAVRVAEYVRGVFGHPHVDTAETSIDQFTFNQAVDILFAEALSIVTFTHITGTSKHTRYVTVEIKQVEDALVRIFNHFRDTYPLPDCEELRYLFVQCDEDKDHRLNLQEFHIFISIYLRYYKYGVQSNRYAATIMKDRVFMMVFDRDEGQGARDDRIGFLRLAFKRFLQMAVSDKKQNQMSHLFFNKFDTNGSGDIDREEFSALLAFFHAPLDEVDVLFISADTDGSGEIDYAEFVVTMTTLLRKLVADFGYNLIHATGDETTAVQTYGLFHGVEIEEQIDLISTVEFGEIVRSINIEGLDVLNIEDFTKVVSEVISHIRTKLRELEEAEITAIAGIDVDATNPYEVIAIKEEASEQVGDIVYVDVEDYVDIDDLIDTVEEETGVSIEDLQDAVSSQIEGAEIGDVIELVAYASSEAVVEAVATAALDEIATLDCPTRTEIVEAIDAAIENGVVDDVITEVEHLTPAEIVEDIAETIQIIEISEEAAVAVEISGDLESETIIESVEDATGTELTSEDIVAIVAEANEASSVEEVVEIIENSSTEQIIDTVTEAVESLVTEPEENEWHYDNTVIGQIEENSGVTIEDFEDVIEQEIGVTVDEAIDAATEAATEQIVDAVTEAVIEEAESNDCPTAEVIQEVIHEVVEDGTIEDIIETIEESTSDEIIQTVEEIIEASSDEEEPVESDHSDSSDHVDITETIEEETGYTSEEIETAVEEQLGDATIEEVVETAEEIATEQVIDAVTEAVVEQAESTDCLTPEDIEIIIEDVIEDGTIDDIVEDIQEADPEDVIETISEEIGGDWHPEPEHYDGHEIIDEIVSDEEISDSTLEEAVEEELGATIEDVIEAVENSATEQVIDAVTEAVIEEAESTECLTPEDIQEVIETVIEDGTIDEIVEDLEDAEPEDIIETVIDVIEEDNYQTPEEHVEEETGYTGEEIETAVEEQLDGATIEDVVEAAEEVATEQVIDAVTEAVIEEAESTDCLTPEVIEDIIDEVIEDGTIDDIVEDIQDAEPEEIIETVVDVIEEDHEDSHHEDVIEEITEDLSDDTLEAVEVETGADITEIVEAAEEIATEEVLDAVAEAVIEEVASNDCPTTEDIQEVIDEVIEDGIVDDIIEELVEAEPEDIVETVVDVIEEEHHDEGLFEELTEETGYDQVIIEAAVEEDLGVSVDDVVATAEALAAEGVIEAVADAVMFDASTNDCPTQESIEASIENVIENGTMDQIVNAMLDTPAEEIVATISEAVEENSYSFLEKNHRLRTKNFLRK